MRERKKRPILRKVLQILLGIFLFMLILPYFIPLSSKTEIPALPYPNSAFFTTSDQVHIHYRLDTPNVVKGKILLVHGLAGSTFSFRNNVADLVAAGYQVVAIDLPAFGYSDRSSGLVHSQVNRAKWLWELLDKLDSESKDTRSWNLLGHSMGASTILAMSNQNPQRVVSLSILDGAVTQSSPSIPLVFDTPVGQWLKVYLRYSALSKDNISKLLSSAYAKTADEQAVAGYLAPLLINKTPSALVDFVKTAKNVNIQDWKYPQTPMLVTWGEKDTWVKPTAIDEIKKYAKDLQVTLFPGQGHCTHETDPGFNKVLIDFLDAHNETNPLN
ncbi:MAG: alpha/beta hydrolase [Erysipelotrichaceae bacterium]